MSDKKYKGRIIKGVGGFYYVDTAEYASEDGSENINRHRLSAIL